MYSPRTILRVTVLVALLAVSAFGQSSTFATITGTVRDSSGALIPAAEIEVTHIETGYVFNSQSNEAGQFTVANLREGTYRLAARAPGFKEFVADNILLNSRDTRRINVTLEVGAVKQTIEVTAGASLIETETAALADTKGREVLTSLPVATRRTWDYVTMSPTVHAGRGNWYMSIGGSRGTQSSITIDGASTDDAGGNHAAPLLDAVESVQEVRISLGQSNADQATMGQMDIITRAGTNDFHGSAQDIYAGPGFRARNPFTASKSTNVQHQLAFSVGGPVFIPRIYDGRNKTFFFFDWEGVYGSKKQTAFNVTVPLEAWRRGDFSAEKAQIVDPLGGGAPFPGNQIPSSRINRTSQTIQDEFYVLPNFGDPNVLVARNYREIRYAPMQRIPFTILRFDHRITDRDLFFGRWTRNHRDLPAYDTTMPALKECYQKKRPHDAVAISYTHTFSPSVMNEFRYGFVRQDVMREPQISGLDVVNRLGLQGLAPNLPDVGGMHEVRFTGLGLTGLGVTGTLLNKKRTHNITDNFNWYPGNHSVKIGTFISRGSLESRNSGPPLFGRTEFTNRYTGHPYADFLLGIPTTMTRSFPDIGAQSWSWTTSFYVSDQWKVNPTLTLNLGLRWDVIHPFREKNDRMAVFDIGTGSVVVPDGAAGKISPLLPTDYVPILEASQAGLPNSLIKTDWNNLAPRFGFAWRPFGPDTVVRGGFGLFYDISVAPPSTGGPPFEIHEPAFTNFGTNPLMYPVVFPSEGVAGPPSFTLPGAMRPDLRIPRSMQYSLTLETQKWDMGFRATYTGTNTRQGLYKWNINSPLADEQLFIDKPRMFPKYPGISYTDNGAGHQYHALTVEAERRMSSGLHYQTYFVWARDIGDLDRLQSPEYAFDRLRERGNLPYVPKWRWSGNLVWEIPFGGGRHFGANSRKVVKAILGGWDLSSVFALEHGRYITPYIRMPDPTGTAFTSGSKRPFVTIRPDHLYDANLDHPTPDKWFDPNGFGTPPIGRFGNSANGVLVGAPVRVWHAGVSKNFRIKERVTFRIQMVANNTLNHPNYRDPNVRLDKKATVARITRSADQNTKLNLAGPRELKLVLRLMW